MPLMTPNAPAAAANGALTPSSRPAAPQISPSVVGMTPARRDHLSVASSLRAPRPRRERAKRGEGDRLREEILEAAEYLLARYGHDGAVSIRAVANRVGCTPPAIYLHFDDKTQLLFEVCARRFRDLHDAVTAAIVGIDDPFARLFVRMRAYIRFGLDHPEHYRILFMGQAMLTPEQWADLRVVGVTGLDGLIDACQEAIDSGSTWVTDPRDLAIELWQGCHGLVSLVISKPKFEWGDMEARIDRVIEVQRRGLAAH
jgi:AcrR family transcriptional regulator